MVPLLVRQRFLQIGSRLTQALYGSDPAAQRNGRAPHGAHAQQYYTGRTGASCPHERIQRMLGTRHRPRIHSHRGQGGSQAQSRRHRQGVAHTRRIHETRVGMEREARRHNTRTAQEDGGVVRLVAHQVHYGPRHEPFGDKSVRRPL